MAADWYVSSVAYAALPQFAASHPYSVGDIIRPLTGSNGWAYRCTTAGTSAAEPGWPGGNNNTVTSGGAVFTNVSGQSAYNWSAPAGTIYAISGATSNRPVAGDRVFVSSDHVETQFFGIGPGGFATIPHISVNRAGAVPPGPADIQSGAAFSFSGSITFDCGNHLFYQGFTFNAGSGTSNNSITFNSTQQNLYSFKNCAFNIQCTNTGARITTGGTALVTWDNCTVQFGNVSQCIGAGAQYPFALTWLNTPNALQGATIPNALFSANGALQATLRGIDLSALTTTIFQSPNSGNANLLLDSCRIAAGVTRYGFSSPSNNTDLVELVNCWDGTNVINERHTFAGDVTTDRSTYLTGGAQDDIGSYSFKLASSTRSDFTGMPLDAFTFDVENTATGVSKTATVEIISSASLNNNDIRLLLEYMGTSGSPIASFGDSIASILTAASALPSSSSTWNSPPATPQKQLLQVSFTPQRAGRVRGLVRLGKASTTAWVNPQIKVT